MCRTLIALLALLVVTAPAAGAVRDLRVCADPNNLPFSNRAGEGFENRLAERLAGDLGARVTYTWWAQRRGFVRNTLRAGTCDVILGVPVGFDPVLTTRPYYYSTYVFVSRHDRGLHLRSFDDPRLRGLTIGVPVVGVDYAATPPAHALARRGLVANVRGYTVFGDYAQPDPPAALVRAVARGEVDVAVAWGPLAGYFAPRETVALTITPVEPSFDPPAIPFVFGIAIGLLKSDRALRDELQSILDRRAADVAAILDHYGVPRVAPPSPSR